VQSIRDLRVDAFAEFFSDCWVTRFKQYDASYLLPHGAIEDEVRGAIRQLIAESTARAAHG
jgi:hypothetical protein